MKQTISENLQCLLQRIAKNSLYSQAIRISKEKYNICGTNIDFLTPQKVLQTYTTVKKKFYYERKNPTNCSWFQNQLRIFIWVLVCYLYLNDKSIQTMNLTDWEFFVPIFYHRDPLLFQFQSILLVKNKASKWTQEEIQLLDKIVKIKSFKNKWNTVARQLYVASNKQYIKTPKQCRQRWLNYLDPSKVHCPWTESQDLILLLSIKQNGKRWAYTVKKLLKKRTQHMVKNRFNSLINLQKKRIGQNKSQQQILSSAILFIKKQKQQHQLQNQRQCVVKIQEQQQYNQEYLKPQIQNNQNSKIIKAQQIIKKQKKISKVIRPSKLKKKKKNTQLDQQQYHPKKLITKRVDLIKTQCNLESFKNLTQAKEEKQKATPKNQGKFPQFFLQDNSQLDFNPFEQQGQISFENNHNNAQISQSHISLCSSQNVKMSPNQQKWMSFAEMQVDEDVFINSK